MMDNVRLAGMMIMFLDRVHRVVSGSAMFVDASNGAVANGAAVVPRYGGTSGDCLERRRILGYFFGRHNGFLVFDKLSNDAVVGGTCENSGASTNGCATTLN